MNRTYSRRVVLAAALIGIVIAMATAGHTVRAATRIYVNDDASGANDGTTWTDAYTSLQQALQTATSGDEVWVARGTYKPSVPSGRDATFQLPDGVKVYGGFAGTETVLGQRDLRLVNTSVLSGNIGSVDDIDNAYHVVTIAEGTAPTLDGFRVRDGNANEPFSSYGKHGAGVLSRGTGAKLSHLWILDNEAESAGGGIYDNVGSSTYSQILLDDNQAQTGAGMALLAGAPVVNDTTFLSNDATGSGGAMYVAGTGSLAYVTNLTVLGGTSGIGAGIDVENTAQLYLTNASISGATSFGNSGAVRVNAAGAKALLRNVILWANQGGAAKEAAGTLTIEDSIVEGGCPVGATCDTNVLDEDPQFILPGADNGGFVLTLDLLSTSPAIDAGTDDVCPSADARGGKRKFDGDADGAAHCDIGSLEYIAEPSISLPSPTSTVQEGQPFATVDVKLSHAYPRPVSVGIRRIGGTATPGDDFSYTGPVSLTVPPNLTSYAYGFSLADDPVRELDETVVMQLVSPQMASLKPPTKLTVTIKDNDQAPTVSFKIAATTGRESVRKPRIVATLSGPNGFESGFSLNVTGTAGAGKDYAGPVVPVIVPPGKTSVVIDLTVLDDGTPEDKETIILTLAGGEGVALNPAKDTYTYTIVDDDRPTTCLGSATTIYGSAAGDVIKGTPGRDVIDGRGGADRITGVGGNDVICGRGGNDTIRGGPGNDRVDGGNGIDGVRGGGGNDRLVGANGNDSLFGETGRDQLSGGAGTDSCDGGPGTDALLPAHGCETVAGVP